MLFRSALADCIIDDYNDFIAENPEHLYRKVTRVEKRLQKHFSNMGLDLFLSISGDVFKASNGFDEPELEVTFGGITVNDVVIPNWKNKNFDVYLHPICKSVAPEYARDVCIKADWMPYYEECMPVDDFCKWFAKKIYSAYLEAKK